MKPAVFASAVTMTFPCGHRRDYEEGDAFPGMRCPECGLITSGAVRVVRRSDGAGTDPGLAGGATTDQDAPAGRFDSSVQPAPREAGVHWDIARTVPLLAEMTPEERDAYMRHVSEGTLPVKLLARDEIEALYGGVVPPGDDSQEGLA